MAKKTLQRSVTYAFVALLFFLFSGYAASQTGWQQIPVDPNLLDEGVEPKCSEAILTWAVDPTTGKLIPITSNPDFSLFYRAGDPERLLIYFDGGGACWDGGTCIGSALTPAAIFTPEVNETATGLDNLSADPDGTGGILSDRVDNPFKEYTQVYIPYCTGDIHIGSKDTEYSYQHPLVLGGAAITHTVRHRGHDNLQFVLAWLQDHYHNDVGAAPDKVVVSGSSAGGYGSLINFPFIKEMLPPETETYLIADSSNGVVTNGFLDDAIGQPVPGQDAWGGVWGARIPDILSGPMSGEAQDLAIGVFTSLAYAYPETRFGQMTAAYDAIQSLILMAMQDVDDGAYDPFTPYPDAQVLATALLEWSPAARWSMNVTSWRTRNYRHYIGAGIGHIELLDPPEFLAPPVGIPPIATTNFFEEDSAQGVALKDWVDDMVHKKTTRWWRTDWRDLSCFPNCLEPLLP